MLSSQTAESTPHPALLSQSALFVRVCWWFSTWAQLRAQEENTRSGSREGIPTLSPPLSKATRSGSRAGIPGHPLSPSLPLSTVTRSGSQARPQRRCGAAAGCSVGCCCKHTTQPTGSLATCVSALESKKKAVSDLDTVKIAPTGMA